jgi:glycine/D-amino acid oxidase-like deaminating enzyme
MTGCAAALELARRGLRVIVLEADAVGAGAPGRSLGHIATGVGSPYTVAIRDFGRDGARTIWETHRENHARLKELLAGLGDSCGYVSRGGFRVALDRDGGMALAESEDLLREDGFPGEFLDHYMLEARFAVTGFAAAYWCMDDAEIDAPAFVQALARAAERAGARIVEASPVRALETESAGVAAHTEGGLVRSPVALLALNTVTSPLLPYLADRIRPVEGRCMAFANDGAVRVPSPARAADGRVYWRQTADGLWVGSEGDLDFEPESTGALTAFARRHLGVGDGEIAAHRRGTRGVSRDGFPFIGGIPGTPLFAAVGVTGPGFGYAMLAALWAGEAIATGRDRTPERYRAGRPFHSQEPPAGPQGERE